LISFIDRVERRARVLTTLKPQFSVGVYDPRAMSLATLQRDFMEAALPSPLRQQMILRMSFFDEAMFLP
jgi:hypothetical protein